MNFSGITARRKVAGAIVGSLLGGVAAATIVAPSAAAAPQGCSAGEVADTVSNHLDLGASVPEQPPFLPTRSLMGALRDQPRAQAESDVRGYFTANPRRVLRAEGHIVAHRREAEPVQRDGYCRPSWRRPTTCSWPASCDVQAGCPVQYR